MSKVEPGVQGRGFASWFLIAQITSPIGLAIAEPLADYVFEPAMQPSGILGFNSFLASVELVSKQPCGCFQEH
jgi:hypothetical protein